jgi:hypothetical protein
MIDLLNYCFEKRSKLEQNRSHPKAQIDCFPLSTPGPNFSILGAVKKWSHHSEINVQLQGLKESIWDLGLA